MFTVSDVYTSTLAAHARKPFTITVRRGWSGCLVEHHRYGHEADAERAREHLIAEGAQASEVTA